MGGLSLCQPDVYTQKGFDSQKWLLTQVGATFHGKKENMILNYSVWTLLGRLKPEAFWDFVKDPG